MLQSLELDLLLRVVFVRSCGRTGTRRIDKREARIKTHLLDQTHRLGKVFLRLSGKAHNEIRRNTDIRAHFAQLGNASQIPLVRVAALHGAQDSVGSALHG